jgi:hypothetical protein
MSKRKTPQERDQMKARHRAGTEAAQIRKRAVTKLTKQYASANARAKYGPLGKPAPVVVKRIAP